MNTVLQPWHLFVVILAGWVNRRQQEAIDYLRTENQVLREVVGKKRIPLTDSQRRRLAIKGKLLGRKLPGDITTIVTPDTILRWHHRLVAMKWDYSHRRRMAGRPPVSREVIDLVLRHDGQQHPAGAWNRTGSRTDTEDLLERVHRKIHEVPEI